MVSIFTGLGAGFERGSGTTLGSSGLLGSGSLGRSNEQVSLNAATGNLLIAQRDEFLVGLGPDSPIGRTYNSLEDVTDGDNNDHWHQGTTRGIHGLTGTLNATGSTVKRTSGDGSDITYAWNGSAYVATAGDGAYDKLTYASGVWTWTDGASQFTEKYAAHGVYGLTGTVNTAGSTITRIKADGTSSVYSWDGATSRYIVSAGTASADNLTYSGGVWTWSNSGAPVTQYYYNNGANWRITELANTIGQKLSFTYAGATLDRVTTQDGSYEQYSWTGGNISQIVTGYTNLATGALNQTLTRTRYGYDAYNRLTTVTVDLSPNDNVIGDGNTYVTTYTYKSATATDPGFNRIATITQTDGSSMSIDYDGAGRVTSLTQAVTGSVTRITSIAYGAGVTTITDPLLQVTTLEYNADGSLKKVTAPPAYGGAAAQVVQFTYDGNGNVLTTTDASGIASVFTYDGAGNMLTSTDRLGNVVTRTYGSRNELLTETREGSDTNGTTAPHTTRYAYSASNLMTYSISPDGKVTQYQYAGGYDEPIIVRVYNEAYDVSVLAPSTAISEATVVSWQVAIVDKTTTIIKNQPPDARGNLAVIRTSSAANSSGTIDTTQPFSLTTFVYDQAGQMLSRTTTGLGTETFVYDGLGRMVASTDLNGNTTSFLFNDAAMQTVVTLTNGYVQTSVFNKAGELVSHTDSGDNVTGGTSANAYDQRGQLRITTDATNHNSYFVYDKTGRKVADVDHYGNLIEYRYDANDRLVATIRYATAITADQLTTLQDPLSNIEMSALRPAGAASDLWTWTIYDAGDRVIETIDGDGGVVTYQYDGESRLVGTTRYYNKLNATELNWLKSTPSGLTDNRLNNSQFSSAAGWMTGYDPSGIVNGGSPFTGVWNNKGFIRSDFTATGAGQVASISTDGIWFGVSQGERLAVQAGVEALGAVGALTLTVWWQDASGNRIGNNDIGSLSGNQVYNTKISGFVTVPAGAVRARLELYMASAGAGAGSFNLVEPMVSRAAPTQVAMPVFTPTVASDPASDSVSRNFYNKSGQLVGVLDGEGYLSRITYDAAGRKVAETAFATITTAGLRAAGSFNDLVASVTATANSADRVMRYVYDGQGYLRFQIDALNHVTEYVYDSGVAGGAIGVVRQSIQYAGTIGALGDYKIATVKTAVAALAGNPDNRQSWAVYDTSNRLAYSIDATGAVTGYSYDNLGQVTKTVRYAALRATTTLPDLATMASWQATNANAADRITYNYYTARGELRYTADPEGYVSWIDYDAEGRAITARRWDTAIAPGAVNDTTTIAAIQALAVGTFVTTATGYDNDGRVATRTDGEGFVTGYVYNANGTLLWTTAATGTSDEARTVYEYDNAGRVVTRYEAYGTAEVAITRMAYDGLGNVLTVTDPNGNITTQTYDRLGQLLTRTDALGGIVRWQYNSFGEVTKLIDERNNASFNYYDNLGRLTISYDAEQYGTLNSYTAFGELASVTRWYNRADNAGSVSETVQPSFTAHAKDATTSFEYDKLGRLTKTIDAELDPVAGGTNRYYEAYSYNAFGNRVSVRNRIGGTTTYAYNKRGLLESETLSTQAYTTAGTAQAGTIVNTFGYDARGNRTTMTEAANMAEHRTTTYVYDKLDRLVETRGDAVPNGTSGASTVPATRIAYDRRGNVIETTDANGARTLSYYDKLDRLIVSVDALGYYSTVTYSVASGIRSEVSRTYATPITLPGLPGDTVPSAPAGAFRESTSTFDKLGRLATSSIANIRTGQWTGTPTSGTYGTAVVTLTISYEYDATSNLIKTTDAGGGVVYSYYDKLGRKTAQVDAELYVTTWSLDGEGNVLTEVRAANRVADPTTGGYTAGAASTDDRTTSFSYDRLGRRLTETRAKVVAYTIDPVTGALTQLNDGSGTIDATVTYTYNGLGEVLTKREATGDTVSYTYDTGGRLTTEQRAAYADYQAGSTTPNTTPTFEYAYDGLNNLVRTRQSGDVSSSVERITQYNYGSGGRLLSMIDGATTSGVTRSYFYDLAGNKVGESYSRLNSGGTATTEGIGYQYDALGRLVMQTLNTVSGTDWTQVGNVTSIAYNAFGEVAKRGISATGSAVMYQEEFEYDGAGRLWRNNSGDGVWRYFISDANGNQTLTIESEGTDLYNNTIDQILAIAAPGGTTVGSAYIDGINATVATFDMRGHATATVQKQRQLNGSGATDIVMLQAYNAFGDIANQTDARGGVTTYAYNTMGRVISTTRPAALQYGSGAMKVSPVDYRYYDISGRVVGNRDANGNLMTQSLLAGTGYGSGEALVVREFHPDGFITNAYDAYGDLRKVTEAVTTRVTQMEYDQLGRLIKAIRPGSLLIDEYSYDVLGQRLKHWNNVLGDAENTDYDIQGRIVSQVAFGGDTTTTSYSWSNGLVTNGLLGAGAAAYGGWTQTTTFANGKTSVEVSDVFSHIVSKIDMGGHITTFSFDLAGRITESAGEQTQRYTYYNTGLAAAVSTGVGTGSSFFETQHAAYTYDAAGNKLTEYASIGGSASQQATASYDELGRMNTWSEAGSGVTAPPADIAWEYDAVGNIIHMTSHYYQLDGVGAPYGATTQEYWYRYDSMNRLTINKGSLTGGSIVRGTNGSEIAYNANGERATVISTGGAFAHIWDPYAWDPYGNGGQGGATGNWVDLYYAAEQQETYTYNDTGTLAKVNISVGGYLDNTDGTVTAQPAYGLGGERATYTYDNLGRMTRQVDWLGDHTDAGYDHQVFYNAKGQVYYESTFSKQKVPTLYPGSVLYDDFSTETWSYFSEGTSSYALGAVTSSTTTGTKNGTALPTTDTTTTYAWYDGAAQSTVTYTPNISAPGTTQTTNYYYNGTGVLTSAWVGDGRPRSITVTSDVMGQVVRRVEADGLSTGDPAEVWYRFNGRQVGYVGNNGNFNSNYDTSITDRTATQDPMNPFRFGSGGAYGDFGQNYDAINSFAQGSSGGTYTVRPGDTLQGIAAALWGDASLWYKLAQANGLTNASALSAGQTLTVPAGVTRVHNNASTFRPYKPGDAYGDSSPTTPAPQAASKKGCGVLGQLLLVVIAVAVTIWASPASPNVWQAVIAAGAGSLASQGVGLATGIQQKFDFKGLALSVVSAGVTAGIGQIASNMASSASGALQKVGGFLNGSGFGANVARGALGSAITQGVGVATGLQSKFDFAGVAAAGIGAGIGSVVGRSLGVESIAVNRTAANVAGNLFANTASGIANAATRSLVNGSDFGDNLMASLPDTIGGTVGSLLGVVVDRRSSNRSGAGPQNDRGATIGAASTASDGSASGVGAGVENAPIAGEGGGRVGRSVSGGTRGNPSLSPTANSRGENAANDALAEVVVTAERDTIHAVRYEDALGNFDEIREEAMARGLDNAEENQLFRGRALSDQILSPLKSAYSFVFDNIPFVGTAKSVTQIYTGTDAVTRQPVNRVIETGTLAVSFIPFGKLIGKGFAKLGGGVLGRAAERGAVRGLGASPYATTGDLVQSIATRADNWGIRNGLGNGPVAGTLKHGYAEEVLTRYQRMFGDRGLTAEARYAGGAPWQPGMTTTGSIRLDVVEGPLTNPTQVWDYKFGQATLSPSRITQIQNGIPNGANVPILMVKP